MSSCEVPLCERDAHARGLCQAHYQWASAQGLLGQFDRKHQPLEGRVCSVDGCERPCKSRLYCSMHAERLRRTGTLGEPESLYRPPNQPCSVTGCDGQAKAQGLCIRHYQQWRRFGDPGPGERLRRRRGTGSIQRGYHFIGKRQVHRDVWEKANGPIPRGSVIHHKNGDKLDNRLENLELMTRDQHVAHHRAEGHLKPKKEPHRGPES